MISATWCIIWFCFLFVPMEIWSQATLRWSEKFKLCAALVRHGMEVFNSSHRNVFHSFSFFFVRCSNICLSASPFFPVRNKRKQKMYRNIIATEIVNNGTFSVFSFSLAANFFVFFSKSHIESIAVPSLYFPFYSVLHSIYLDKRKFANIFGSFSALHQSRLFM